MTSVPLTIRNQIDQLCDRFDRSWTPESLPAVTPLLDELESAVHQPLLLKELLLIDQDRRREQHAPVLLTADYQEVLPRYAELIAELNQDLEADQSPRSSAATPRFSDADTWPVVGDGDDDVRIGKYLLTEKIGRGGMGVVYRAVDEQLHREVAVKILAVAAEEAIPRFQAEAQLVAGLKHPHIVQIYETGDHNGRPYLALELIEGGTLEQELNRELLTPHRAALLTLQTAQAVVAAHELGIVHRDLKPANVLLDKLGRAKLADFGLARDLNAEGRTIDGTLLGTPGYMAPEQTVGQLPTPSVDIYGLGAILYATLTGRPPFRGSNIPETLRLVRDSDPVPVRTLQPGVPRDLESICLKCLQKQPGDRYASATELVHDLLAFQEGRPVTARPISRSQQIMRWCRRHPSVALLSSLVVLVFCAGLAGITWQWLRAEYNAGQYRQAAESAAEQTTIAEEEAAIAEAVNEFMIEVLTAAKPSRMNREATVRNAVDQASELIDGAFSDRPRVEAGVRMALGETYRALDEADRAVYHYRIAVELCRNSYGLRDHHTLNAMDRLAGSLRYRNIEDDLAEARQLRESVVKQHTRLLGPAHRETLIDRNNLATVLMDMNDLAGAANLYRRSLELAEQNPDMPAAETRSLRYNLATLHHDFGLGPPVDLQHLKTAEAMLRRVISESAAEIGEVENAEIDMLLAKNELAGVLHHSGQPAAAISMYREVLASRQRILGRDHQHTLSTHRRLTRLLVEQQDYEAALPLLQEALALHNDYYGPDRSLTFGVRQSLADCLTGLNRWDEAEAFLKETVAILAENRGNNHDYTNEARDDLQAFHRLRPPPESR